MNFSYWHYEKLKNKTIKTLEHLGYGAYNDKCGTSTIFINHIHSCWCYDEKETYRQLKKLKKENPLSIYYGCIDNDGIGDIYEIINTLSLKRSRNFIDNLFFKKKIVTLEDLVIMLNK